MQQERIMRLPEVIATVGLSSVSIWRLESNNKFPKKIKLGGHSIGYLQSEILGWIETKAEERN